MVRGKISLIFLLILFLVTSSKYFNVYAVSVATSLIVGNNAPTFSQGPIEDPTSTSTTPTNVGEDVTFKATGVDSNENNYYLILCSSDSVTANNGGAPSCDDTQYCVSTSTVSGTQATCSKTAQVGDPISNTWYAFVCDGPSSGALCSTSSQGSGDSGSPFEVNHHASFSAISNDGPKDPGTSITWSTTSSDSDSDTVKLLVCKTEGILADECDGGVNDTWCSSTLVASNASCSYSIPSVYPDGTYDAYVYIVDEHDFQASGVYQGSNSSFTVNNTSPTVSSVTINGGSNITLLENTTQAVTLTAIVTDSNSCFGTEISSVLGYTYRSGITYTGCDTLGEGNNNYCYPEISCTVVGGTCTDNTDASAQYTCTVNIYYHADPTDTATQYPDDTWLATIKATDDDSGSDDETVAVGVEMNSLTAASITNSINFGNLGIEQSNDPLDKIVNTTPTGNVGLDQEHSSSPNMCTDYPTCSGGTPIAVTYQKYSMLESTAYSSGTTLTTTPSEIELNVAKATSLSPTLKSTWWGILVPTGTLPGTYSGANTLTVLKGEILDW